MKKHIVFKAFRKLFIRSEYSEEFVKYRDQEANDYILQEMSEALKNHTGLMISKFGTIELRNIVSFEAAKKNSKIQNFINAIHGEYSLYLDEPFEMLCNNAGFFPKDQKLLEKYVNLTIDDIKCIDILGSYLVAEKYVKPYLNKNCNTVNLDGYYAPFMWNNPWTRLLKDKKVLVIHPFVRSIKNQYDNKRELLFENKDVLPKFKELYLIEAVQSIADNDRYLNYKDWFEALDSMKSKMDKIDYDIALIGCGAYGMNLAAHAKRQGKIAVHLAGWTQMLFGIYGNRWINDQPYYKKFINSNWIRPLDSEKPKNAKNIENGCYW